MLEHDPLQVEEAVTSRTVLCLGKFRREDLEELPVGSIPLKSESTRPTRG